MYKLSEAQNWLEFYTQQLNTAILPFWLKRSMDTEYGGYFTCFDNTGTNLVSYDKYTWSQGRMVWILSKLAGMKQTSGDERQKYITLACSGAEFLMKNCLLENGNSTFVMNREGTAKLQAEGQDCDTSIYADCFVVIGLSKYAAVSGSKASLDFAVNLYESILKRVDSYNFKSEPYPVPRGYKAHGIPMIMLNTSQELSDAMQKCGYDGYKAVEARADGFMKEIMNCFVGKDYVLNEMVAVNGENNPDVLLSRYVNPGHTIECMWFVMHQAMLKGDNATIIRASEVIKKVFANGWDTEFGGLQLFADRDGGMPRGSIEGMEDEKMVQKVINDWSSKLWWTHSEALYSLLLAYHLTGEAFFLDAYKKVFNYTFKVFPNPDKEIGEWIQIRDRRGEAEQRLVALPVKDPFHIARNFMLIIELLESCN